MLTLDYTIDIVWMGKASVNTLKIVNPRKLRKSQVASLASLLLKGKHFDSCLVVSRKGGHLRIIDGQHRIEAMKQYFKKFPDEKIQVALVTYKKLSPDAERNVYRKWNVPIKQSTDDFINSYRETIPMFNRITMEIPCSIYGSTQKMRLRDLINAYIAAKENPYMGGEKKTTYDFVRYMQRLEDKDVDEMKSNFNLLQDVFNPNGVKDFQKLSAFKNIVFRSIYYLVANNVGRLGGLQLKHRMKKALVNRTILDEYRRYYGRRASVDAYLSFKNILNLKETEPDKMFV